MNRFRLGMWCGVLWCCPLLSVAQEVTAPQLEDFQTSSDATAFVGSAKTFLKAHGSSPYAPRVAMDLLMIADRMGDEVLVNQSKGVVLLDYPDSTQAHYVLGTFGEAEALREFLMRQVQERMTDDPGQLPEAFCRVLDAAIPIHQGKLFDDAKFLIMTYCLGDAAANDTICQGIMPIMTGFSDRDTKFSPVAGIVLDRQRPLSERVDALYALENDYSKFPLQFYLNRLTEEEARDPRIQQIGFAMAMQNRKPADALEVYERMPATLQNTPKHQYWRACALKSIGADADASEVLRDLVVNHPESQWANPASNCLAGIERHERVQTLHARDLLALFETLKHDVSLFQVTVEYSSQKKELHTIYVASDSSTNYFECVIEKNGVPAVAYRTSRTAAAFLLSAESEVLIWPKPGPIPMPNFDLKRMSDDTFVTNFEIGMESTLSQAGEKGLKILSSPYLSSESGLREILGILARRHSIVSMEPVHRPDGSIEHGWLKPSWDEPRLALFKITLSPNRKITSLEMEQLKVTSLQYGPRGSFELSMPSWPDHPKRLIPKNAPTIVMKAFGAVLKLFKP